MHHCVADCFSPFHSGMSKWVKRRKYFKSLRGTPYYIAPEVIQGRYTEHCDVRNKHKQATTNARVCMGRTMATVPTPGCFHGPTARSWPLPCFFVSSRCGPSVS